MIGLSEAEDILEEAADLLGVNSSLDRTIRNDQLDKTNHEALDDLDTRYYDLVDAVDRYLMDYIRRNRNEFQFNSIVTRPKD